MDGPKPKFYALNIATVITAVLQGVLTVQTYEYFATFKKDPLWMKFMVAVAWVVDFCHLLFAVVFLYHFTIPHPGAVPVAFHVHWSLGAFTALEPVSATITQLFFARRVYMVNINYWPWALLAVALCAVSSGAAIKSVIDIIQVKEFSNLVVSNQRVYPIMWFTTGLAADLAVTVPVAYALWKRRGTGLKDTDRLLTNLVFWVISTGALTATLAALTLALFIVNAGTLLYAGTNLILPSLYLNSLVAFLNQRGRHERQEQRKLRWPISPSFPMGPVSAQPGSRPRPSVGTTYGSGDSGWTSTRGTDSTDGQPTSVLNIT